MTNGSARPPTKHYFFKPLLPGFLHEFLIPIAFFTKYLGGDPDREDDCKAGGLRSCSGKPFPVNIKGRRLEAGWPEFATAHDLQVGYFVVFGHEGALVFDVRVYDLSACERLYPRSVDPGEEAGVQSQPIGVEDDSDAESMKTADFVVSGRAMKKQEGIIQPKAVAVSFPSHPKHPSFSHILTFTNVRKSVLYLPLQFAKENGLSKRSCEIILRDEEGRKWPVQLRYSLRCGLQQKVRVFIGGGWGKLAIANGLKIGDCLRFELVKNGTKPVANIYVVTRWTKQSSSAMNPKSESESKADPSQQDMGQCSDVKALKNITERSKNIINPKHPFFVGVVKTCRRCLTVTCRRCLTVYVPINFARHINLNGKHDQLIVKDDKGGSWPVRLYYRQSGETYMGRGWWSLIDANGLKNGDYFTVILLEQGAELVASFHVSERETKKLVGISQPKAGATSFPSHTKHPTFSHVLTRVNIEKAELSLPHQFAQENGLLKRSCEMTLRDQVGRTWPVKLRHRLHNHLLRKGGHRAYIGGGLRKLVIANGLKTGDRLRFELIKQGGKPAANVYVGQPIDHFISSVKPYSLKRGRFTIPVEFARAHNLVGNACVVTLQNQEGCSWAVTLHRAKRSGRFYLLNGWLKFALDNHIKAGDSVRFELVKNRLNPIMKFSVVGSGGPA